MKERFNKLLWLTVLGWVVLMLQTPLQMQAQSRVQVGGITIKVANMSLGEVIELLKTKTGKDFMFSNREVNIKKPVTVDFNNAPLPTVLNAIFGDGFQFEITPKIVIIKPVEAHTKDIKQTTPEWVKGRVTDSSGDPLVGVNVIIEGTTRGIQTDLDGQFSLSAEKDAQLKLTYVGFEDIITKAFFGKSMHIIMIETISDLGEVVVNGYFTRRTEGYAGAVTTLKREEIQKLATGNIFTTISALDAGFKISENNSMGASPNTMPDFSIRGKGSFQDGSTTPLFIMDGFEVSIEKVYDTDINRIESITILKDASATILYGSKAANGVVVIETVAPKSGQIQVTYDFKPTIALVDLSDYNLMNAEEKLNYEVAAGLYDKVNSPANNYEIQQSYYRRYKNIAEGVNTYWLKQPVRNAFSQAHSLYINGGEGAIRYGIDGQFNQTNGVMKESGRDRYGLGFRLIYRIKEKITVQNYASYAYTHAYNSLYGSFSTYAQLNPYDRIRNNKGEILPTLLDGSPNPLYDAKLPNRDFTNTQYFTDQLKIDWTITEEWRLRGQLGIEKGITKKDNYISPFSSRYIYDSSSGRYTSTPVETRGELTLHNGETMNMSGNFTLNYTKLIGKKHLLYASIGGEVLQDKFSIHGFTATGFSDDRYSDPTFAIQYKENTKPYSTESITRSIGTFANINYLFDNRFFADFSGRYDGSSLFGADRRWAPFGSIGGGWNIHNEHFLRRGSALDLLKIRISYGITGNQEFQAYQARTMYQYQTGRLYNTLIAATLMGYGNPELKWQNQHQTNIGLDLGMWKDRLKASFNYYNKLTDGMLTQVTVAPSIGLPSNDFTSNLGEIRNRGFEVNINGAIIQNVKKNLEWRAWAQISHNKNTLSKISNQLKNINATNNLETVIPGAVYEEGESMNAIKAVKSLGIDPVTGQEIFLKKDGKTITYTWDPNDKVLCGDKDPDIYGNIGTNVYWKGWNLNMIFGYELGADYYNSTLATRVEGINPAWNGDRRALTDRWSAPGQHARYKNIKEYETNYISSRFIQNRSYLHLTSLSLSYDFRTQWMKQAHVSNLRLSFYANDLFYLSTVKAERGLDYPFQRSYTFGLNISL